MATDPKQRVIEANTYKKFIGLLDAALKNGYYLVAGSLQQWKIDGEEYAGIEAKYIAVVEEPYKDD